MANDEDGIITTSMAVDIYNKLQEEDFGEIPYGDHRILFEAGYRDDNNIPESATVQVINEDTGDLGLYNLLFEQ